MTTHRPRAGGPAGPDPGPAGPSAHGRRAARWADQPEPPRQHRRRTTSSCGGSAATPRCSASTATPSTSTRVAAARAGVGAPVVDYRPDLGVLVIGFLDGTHLRQRLVRRPRRRAPGRAGDPAAARRAALQRRLRHVRAAGRATSGPCGTRAIRCFDGYADHDDAFHRVERALAVRAEPTVPCNNDLLAGNFVDDGAQVWLIDYEYSGNNDACFELGNTGTECDLDDDQVEALVAAYYGRPPAGRAGAGAAAGAGVGRTAGRCGARSRPPRATSTSTSTSWGQERFEKAARGVHLRPASRPCSRRRPVPTSSAPVPRPRRRRRRRRDRHQHRLPPDPARLDRRAAARAGQPVRRHDLARGRAGRAAARVGERHAAGAVLRRALRPARGGDRAVRRLQAVRRGDRGPHPGPDDPAAPHRGHRRRVRPRVRAADPRRGAGALAGDAGRRPGRRDLAARRRQGQPDRPDPGAGQGRAAGRRPDRRAGPRHRTCSPGTARSPACAPTGATSRPRWWSTAPASGRPRSARWPGCPCRCTRPSTSTWSPTRSRACTPTCRSCATPTAGPTSRRRSAASSSAASSPRPSRGCRPTGCPTRSSSRCSTRTGTTSRC